MDFYISQQIFIPVNKYEKYAKAGLSYTGRTSEELITPK